jgi:hypothetical protein
VNICNNPEDSNHHSYCYENRKSHILWHVTSCF